MQQVFCNFMANILTTTLQFITKDSPNDLTTMTNFKILPRWQLLARLLPPGSCMTLVTLRDTWIGLSFVLGLTRVFLMFSFLSYIFLPILNVFLVVVGVEGISKSLKPFLQLTSISRPSNKPNGYKLGSILNFAGQVKPSS